MIEVLANNPQLLAALMAVIYNFAGYAMSMLNIRAFEKYKLTEIVKTLVLFETLFTLLMSMGGVSTELTTIITVVLAVVVSLKDKVSKLAEQTESTDVTGTTVP